MVSSSHECLGLPALLVSEYVGSAVPGTSVTCLMSCCDGALIISPSRVAALSCIISDTRTILIRFAGFLFFGVFIGKALILSLALCRTNAFLLDRLTNVVLMPSSCLSPFRWNVFSLSSSSSGRDRLSSAYTSLAMIRAL